MSREIVEKNKINKEISFMEYKGFYMFLYVKM